MIDSIFLSNKKKRGMISIFGNENKFTIDYRYHIVWFILLSIVFIGILIYLWKEIKKNTLNFKEKRSLRKYLNMKENEYNHLEDDKKIKFIDIQHKNHVYKICFKMFIGISIILPVTISLFIYIIYINI